jgi:hypothetical protein
MEDLARIMIKFDTRFPSEESCREYLFKKVRWPRGFRCYNCKSTAYYVTGKNKYMCRECGLQISLTAGSIIESTKMPLRQWFRAFWYITSQEYAVSARDLQMVLGLNNYRVARQWLQKAREAMVNPDLDLLSGTVEAGEFRVDSRDGKVRVMVAVEVQASGRMGNIRMEQIDPARDSDFMTVVDLVRGGTRIQPHSPHSLFLDTDLNLSPRLSGVVQAFNEWFRKSRHSVGPSVNIRHYLNEFTFRFNNRHKGRLFYRLVKRATEVRAERQDWFRRRRLFFERLSTAQTKEDVIRAHAQLFSRDPQKGTLPLSSKTRKKRSAHRK